MQEAAVQLFDAVTQQSARSLTYNPSRPTVGSGRQALACIATVKAGRTADHEIGSIHGYEDNPEDF
ncbi:hypothetical protein P0D88_52000 [Paraburkholderia sp. RL18-103-BIB-C]|jgi:hypothetical protein|uniref:hypothetical protein n=1 Tax=unclassified Paraburkholderia TaxID=2615204 RepID=UPI0038BC74D8